jgi:uncharacterized protein (DUF1800 family)
LSSFLAKNLIFITVKKQLTMKPTLSFIFSCIFSSVLFSQPYTDYIGAGHNKGIVVTTSSDEERENVSHKASGDKTISGDGLNGKRMEAARFLYQSAFGYNEKEVDEVVNLGIETWISQQKNIPQTKLLTQADSFAKILYHYKLANGEDSSDVSLEPGWQHFRYAWWNTAVNGKDQLRQRVAFALSQILVISDRADIGNFARGMSSYADLLGQHAFGNYKDLLLDVTLHPLMGSYLSHLNNPKEIPEENIHPDQNFTREIMQLFSIGLYELNLDGSRKTDASGNFIPTYNNDQIAELAKVFTGLGIGESLPDMGDLYFGRGLYGSNLTKPMKIYEDWHQEGEKKLLNGLIIPAGQNGMKDIEDAVDMLFNHPNVGPFISRQLIQRLIKSNPSPAYISRVASIFNNDGTNVRGNLYAVVKAILLDEEARNCGNLTDATGGKMTEPVLRLTHFFKAIGVYSESKYFFHHGYDLERDMFQHPFSSPSVFNFFTPDYKPSGLLSDANLNAPEFQILNTLSSLDFGNLAFGWTYYEYIINNWEGDDWYAPTNASKLIESAQDDEVLINKIDFLFTNGQMSDFTRATIKEAIQELPPTINGTREKINTALYLTLISPDYIIKK